VDEAENEIPGGVKKQGLIKRLTLTGQLTRFVIYLAALIPLAICVILTIFTSSGVFNALEIQLGETLIYLGRWYDFIIIGVIISTAVYGIYEFFRLRRVRKIDERFPDFVRDLAESRRAGMTFTKAIMYASKGNYGVLTDEIKKIAMQISWGSSVENALNAFAKRVNTKLTRRTISLIIEASRSGGNVADVLDAASKDAREIKLLESERRAGMLSYVAVIYVSMFVFLVIIVILSKTLIPNMLTGEATGGVGIGSSLRASEVTMLFFCAGILQCGFMGIVAGVFEEGNLTAGVKHSFVMILVSWVVFKFIIGNI
jgi:flagellar protein FlaJ